ncbi:MAG: response regulator [Heliobacteriaceae bacterium]|nr:response regulator [Heliobacteriaceae bacterium]MDD4588438.1 response regulator [Heliobacteriaceae bacterium]
MARILVVDDMTYVRAVLKKILVQAGHEVVGEATDGAEAVSEYQEIRPDLVTMDITMPNVDGIAALKAIRQLDTEARVIMCSAMGQEAFVKQAILSGACDFIVKPFRPEKIVKTINRQIVK